MTLAHAATSSSADPGVRHLILGTAGHIDHGKSSLVKALTGTDPDRLPEEKRRGMTIELGFAELDLGDVRFGVVDVPGHERFVRTMVAGATGIDAALIVVAADDAVMPQSVEHVEILRLLGVRRAVAAVTKIDLVDDETVALAAEEVRGLLSGTPLAGAEIVPVSSSTGAGLDHLRAALRRLGDQDGPAAARPPTPFRMAIDRVFTVAGRGTVVTGSVLRGRVAVGDELELWPGGLRCRVRGLQTHGAASGALEAGQRAALNLTSAEREAIARGSELATPGYLRPARMIDVVLNVARSHSSGLKSARTVRLCIGTTECPVRVVLYGDKTVSPGGEAYAQLRAGAPLTATWGQRFILRDEDGAGTIGGGAVLRPVSRRRRRDLEAERASLVRLHRGDAADRLEECLREAGFQPPADLHAGAATGIELADLPGVYEQLIRTDRWVSLPGDEVRFAPDTLHDLQRRLTRRLERFHRSAPDEPGQPVDAVLGWLQRSAAGVAARALLHELVRRDGLRMIGNFVGLPAFAPTLSAADLSLLGEMLRRIETGGFSPPLLAEFLAPPRADRKRLERLARLAVATGQLVRIADDLYLTAETERRLRRTVADLIGAEGGASVARIRQALNSSRKYTVPYVEYLDRLGVTRRAGDLRLLAGGITTEAQRHRQE